MIALSAPRTCRDLFVAPGATRYRTTTLERTITVVPAGRRPSPRTRSVASGEKKTNTVIDSYAVPPVSVVASSGRPGDPIGGRTARSVMAVADSSAGATSAARIVSGRPPPNPQPLVPTTSVSAMRAPLRVSGRADDRVTGHSVCQPSREIRP